MYTSSFLHILLFCLQKTKLERLGMKYGVTISYLPKYHCEMSTIEGLWCYLKFYIGKYSEQNFTKMVQLVVEVRKHFEEKQIDRKLTWRFWKTIYAYNSGKEYKDVLTLFFSSLCLDTIQSHRRITNAILDS